MTTHKANKTANPTNFDLILKGEKKVPKGAITRKLTIEQYNCQWLGDSCEDMMKDLNADIHILI